MSNMYSEVNNEQAIVLEDLEKLIGETIPCLEELTYSKMGFIAENFCVIELSLYNCKLTKLPKSIEKFTNLKALRLDSNHLRDVPKSLVKLKSLQSLNLNLNNLGKLPDWFGQLKTLKILDLRYTKLTRLPKSFEQLEALQKLNLEDNLFTEFPKSVGDLKSLKQLKLGGNQLKNLPEFIGNLKHLQQLDLASNQLTTLPESIGNLESLQELMLGRNQLSTLPDSFGGLKSLRDLSLMNNQISTLPESFGQLKSLQRLWLEENQLKKLPGSLWQLKNLRVLGFEKNPWEGEWKQKVSRDIPSLLQYCRKIADINVFITYATSDYEDGVYSIMEITHNLASRKEIHSVYHRMQNLGKKEDFHHFMKETISNCQFFLLFATKKSLQSEDCKHELALARSNNIKIIPILGKDLDWNDAKIQKMELHREYGLTFKDYTLLGLCDEIYDYIHKYKREHNVFEREKEEIEEQLLNIKNTINNFFESHKFEEILQKNLSKFKVLFQELEENRILLHEFYLKFGSILLNSR